MKILVTGWRRGIGAKIVELLETQGDAVLRFEGDVTEVADWSKITGLLDDLDGLVNCAGIPSYLGVVDETIEGIKRTFDVNLIGPWLGMQTVLPEFIQRGKGSIVNITSIYASDSGVGKAAAYHASKQP